MDYSGHLKTLDLSAVINFIKYCEKMVYKIAQWNSFLIYLPNPNSAFDIGDADVVGIFIYVTFFHPNSPAVFSLLDILCTY